MMNPETQKDSREACTAFELQVPVSQRRVMEELFTKSFKGSTANVHHHDVFYRAVQAQRLHEESYRVVAAEGYQDIQHIFHFESRLQQQFPEIESILPTLKSTAPNDHGLRWGRYNISDKDSGHDGNNVNNPGHDGNDGKSLSRNSRVRKLTSANFHTVSRSKESMSKCTDLRVASL
jgi:hypothetical protein